MSSQVRLWFAVILLSSSVCGITNAGDIGTMGGVEGRSETRPEAAFDDSSRYVARTWTTEDGLPQNSVWCIEQTDDGALWAGTLGGLARFDGQTFQTFRAATEEGLVGNRIRMLFEDRSGMIWIGTENGLSVRRAGTFETVETAEHVFTADQAPDGTMWLGGRLGLYRSISRPKSKQEEPRVERISVPDSLGDFTIWDLEAEGDSVWMAVHGRVYLYSEGTFRPARLLPASETGVRRVKRGPEGRLWVATLSGLYSVSNGTVTRHPYGGHRIRTIRFGGNGDVWLTTFGGGLVRVGRSGAHRVAAEGAIPNRVAGLVRDHSGQWWVGSNFREGLIRLRSPLFRTVGSPRHQTVTHAVHAGEDGTVWVGTGDRGVFRIAKSEVRSFAQRSGLSGPDVLSVGEDRSGGLWVGLTGGLFRRRGQNFREVRTPDGEEIVDVRVVYRDSTGPLWVASSYEGVFRYQDGELRRQIAPRRYDSSRILGLHRDDHGALWIATRAKGVGRHEDGTITWYDEDDGLPYRVVRDVHETRDGTIWVTTYGGGIARFDGSGFTPVTPQDGLPSGKIHVIHESPEGMLWMTSNSGVFRVPRRQVEAVADGRRDRIYVQRFGASDGMPTRECNGNFQPAIAEDADGRLWIPTIDGLTVVDPDDPRLSVPREIPVRVSHARVDGEPVPVDSLRLAPSSYRLAVDFAATSLRHSDDLSFRYRLDEGSWTSASGRQTAEFTNLSAGSHTFEVEATLNGETWYRPDTPLVIFVEPHFYETGWFRLLVGLAVVGLVGGAYWLRVRTLQRRKRELEHLVAERTERLAREKQTTEAQAERLEALDAEKNRFFANISHELRTPLTIFKGTIQDLIEGNVGDVSVSVREKLEILRSNATRLHRLTEQLLDLSRLETAGAELEPEPRDLVADVQHVAQSLVPMAERKGIEIGVETVLERHPCRVDPEKIEKIVSNLLVNAVQHTPKGGAVTLHLELDEGDPPETVLRVADTGRGIPPERQEDIFRRFNTTAGSGADEEGTGIGLALAREYVELHGGTIGVESTPGKGSTFTVRLPLRRVGPEELDAGRQTPALATQGSSPAGETASESEPADTRRESASDRPTLLVVEDNADVRAYLRRHLSADYNVLEAPDGAEALSRARNNAPDLILTDLMMPELNGIELCDRIRNDDDLGRTPVVLLTARAAEEDAVAGLEAGADAYVTKPFSITELKARLRRLLEAHWAGAATGDALRRPARGEDSTEAGPFLNRVTEAIDANLSRSSFSVEELASEVGLSRRQLQRKLKRLTDQTPAHFLRHYRLDVAAQRLEATDQTVRRVADEVGFGTAETFRNHFKERYGCPPSAYPEGSTAPS